MRGLEQEGEKFGLETRVFAEEHHDPSCIQKIGPGSDGLEKQTPKGRKKLTESESHNPSKNQ